MTNKVNFDDLENVLPNEMEIAGYGLCNLDYTGDREDLEQQAWYNDWVYHVLMNHVPALDRSTGWPYITQKFYDCVKHDGFMNLQIEGYSNSGKSWWAFARAIELLEWWSYRGVYGVIWLAQSKSKVLRLVRHGKTGDVMFCDEETKNTGQESKQDETAIENILDACRINGVSFFFLDPDADPKPNVHAKVRITSLARDAYYTFSLVYTPKGRLKGFDDTQVPCKGFDIKTMEWDSRIGTSRSQAKNWRILAILSVAAAILLTATLLIVIVLLFVSVKSTPFSRGTRVPPS